MLWRAHSPAWKTAREELFPTSLGWGLRTCEETESASHLSKKALRRRSPSHADVCCPPSVSNNSAFPLLTPHRALLGEAVFYARMCKVSRGKRHGMFHISSTLCLEGQGEPPAGYSEVVNPEASGRPFPTMHLLFLSLRGHTLCFKKQSF